MKTTQENQEFIKGMLIKAQKFIELERGRTTYNGGFIDGYFVALQAVDRFMTKNLSSVNFCRNCETAFSNDGQLSHKCKDGQYICNTCFKNSLPF